MLRLFDRHRRLREQLSAYIDEELNAADVQRIERHLADCDSCREELRQLRATASALRDLPDARAPRSFALRPAQVEQRRPAAAPTPWALALGARVAAAGMAAALAVVLVVDAAEFGGGGASEPATAPPSEREADDTETTFGPSTGGAERDMEDGQADEPVPGGEALDTGDGGTTSLDRHGGATGAAGGAADVPDMPKTPEGDAAEPPAQPREQDAEQPNAQPRTQPEEQPERDGGFDALTAAEIGLAAAFAVLVVASVGLTVRARRR